MIDAGDVHLADLDEERRRQVLVVSNRQFHQLSGRVLVAPQLLGDRDEVPFPWRVDVDGALFAVDLMRSMPTERLRDRTGRASAEAMRAVRRAIVNIT